MGSAAKDYFHRAKYLFEEAVGSSTHEACSMLREAEELCRQAVAINVKHARAHQLLGLIAWRHRRLEDAEALLNTAVRIKPEDGHVKACLAEVRKCRGGSETEVLELYRRAVSLAPESSTVAMMAASYFQSKDMVDEAHQLLKQAVEVDPMAASPWYKLGKLLHRMTRYEEAMEVLEEALRLDPGHGRAAFWLAAVCTELGKATNVPDAAPSDYVTKLFDGYADRFDEHLVEHLGYRTPQLLVDRVRQAVITTRVTGGGQNNDINKDAGHQERSCCCFEAAVDLGCGTGLSGEALRPLVRGRLVGVDLSGGMLDKARHKAGVYDELHQGDLIQVLQRHRPPQGGEEEEEKTNEGARTDGGPPSWWSFQLFFAADVLVYLGDVRPLLATCRAMAAHDPITGTPAIFAFSTEAWMAGDEGKEGGYKLQRTGRYAHKASYLRATAKAEGWEVLSLTSEPIRQQRGEAIIGHLVVLQVAAATP